MKQENEEYKQLRKLVESAVGMQMHTPKDFDLLASSIYNRTHTMISSQTLKRFWGYLSAGDMRRSSLDALCRFVGYTNWDGFTNKNDANGGVTSNFLFQGSITTEDMVRGDKLRILWQPDRCIVVRFEGQNLFTVEESVNSKLQPGDMFHCHHFIEGNSLQLTCVVRPGMEPCNYVCGRMGGIAFQRI